MEDIFIMMELIMKGNLKKVREKDLVNQFGQMVKHILVNGNKMLEMDLEKNIIAMHIMKENLNNAKEKVMDHSFIMMGKYLKAIITKIKGTEKAI